MHITGTHSSQILTSGCKIVILISKKYTAELILMFNYTRYVPVWRFESNLKVRLTQEFKKKEQFIPAKVHVITQTKA